MNFMLELEMRMKMGSKIEELEVSERKLNSRIRVLDGENMNLKDENSKLLERIKALEEQSEASGQRPV